MKRFAAFFLLAVFALCLFSCGKTETDLGDAVTLYVYNWGEYISDGSEESLDVNAEFENYCREVLGRNVKVNYSTYSSNEDLYAKLSSGTVAYDVVIPSDYMVARFISEKLIQPLDFSLIPNYEDIDPQFRDLYYDAENAYSVPYTYGTVGIIYNTEMVDEDDPDLLAKSWNLMWSDKYTGNILQFNNPRDGFMTAQCLLGYDINSENISEWEEALEKLKEQKSVVQGYVMDEIFNKMKGGSAAISTYYVGDFFTMYADNELLDFYYPVEGTNVFVDAMCIPSSAPNYELANIYINFMLDTEIATANAEYICYASPLMSVRENEEYIECMEECHPKAIEYLYDFDMSTMEFYHDLPDDVRDAMNSLWEDLKIESTIGVEIFVICGVIVLAGLVFIAIGIITREKRDYYFKKYSV